MLSHPRTSRCLLLAAGLCLSLAPLAHGQSAEGSALAVAEGRTVSIDYQLKLPDGTQLETSAQAGPMTFVVGKGEFFPAAEAQLAGMKAGDEKTLKLASADAFGPVNPDLLMQIDKEQVPEEMQKPGTIIGVKGPDGEVRRVRVHETRETVVVVDLNHPLAGKDVVVDIQIISVE